MAAPARAVGLGAAEGRVREGYPRQVAQLVVAERLEARLAPAVRIALVARVSRAGGSARVAPMPAV